MQAPLCSLLLTLSERSHILTHTFSTEAGRETERERASCRPLSAGSFLPLADSRVLHWPHHHMGLQTWPPIELQLFPMACLDVETPSICRGKFKSGTASFFLFFLTRKLCCNVMLIPCLRKQRGGLL